MDSKEDGGGSGMWEFGVNRCKLFFFFVFLGPHPRHMEVPRLGAELKLHLPADIKATTTPNLSHICDLHHSSWQGRILNPLSAAGDQTCVLVDAS